MRYWSVAAAAVIGMAAPAQAIDLSTLQITTSYVSGRAALLAAIGGDTLAWRYTSGVLLNVIAGAEQRYDRWTKMQERSCIFIDDGGPYVGRWFWGWDSSSSQVASASLETPFDHDAFHENPEHLRHVNMGDQLLFLFTDANVPTTLSFDLNATIAEQRTERFLMPSPAICPTPAVTETSMA